MSNYPFMKIHSSSEQVNEVDYLDISYTSEEMFNVPTITAIAHSETDNANVNVSISNITITSARLNFSSKFTGTVKYTIISIA